MSAIIDMRNGSLHLIIIKHVLPLQAPSKEVIKANIGIPIGSLPLQAPTPTMIKANNGVPIWSLLLHQAKR